MDCSQFVVGIGSTRYYDAVRSCQGLGQRVLLATGQVDVDVLDANRNNLLSQRI